MLGAWFIRSLLMHFFQLCFVTCQACDRKKKFNQLIYKYSNEEIVILNNPKFDVDTCVKKLDNLDVVEVKKYRMLKRL